MRTYRRGSRYATAVALARAQDAISTIDRNSHHISDFTAWRADVQHIRTQVERTGAIVASRCRRWHETATGVAMAALGAAALATALNAIGVPKLAAVLVAIVVAAVAAVWPARWVMTAVYAYGRRRWSRIQPEPVSMPPGDIDAATLLGGLVSALVRANTELRLAKLGGAAMPGGTWWSVDRAEALMGAAWQTAASTWGRVVEGWAVTSPAEIDEVPNTDEVHQAGRAVADAAQRLEPLLSDLSMLSTRHMVTWTTRLLIARSILWRTAGSLRYTPPPATPATPSAVAAELGTIITAITLVMVTMYAAPIAVVATVAAAAAAFAAPLAVRIVRWQQMPYVTRRSRREYGRHLGASVRAIREHIALWAGEARYIAHRTDITAHQVRASQTARVPWRTEAAEAITNARAWISETEHAMRTYTRDC